MTVYQRNEKLKKIVVVLVTGLTAAIALNYFLIPANVFSARDEWDRPDHCLAII